MLLSLSSLWQQPTPPTVLYVRGGLLLALSSLLETTGEIIIIPPPPPLPAPVRRDDGGLTAFGRPGMDMLLRHRADDEIVELMAILSEIL